MSSAGPGHFGPSVETVVLHTINFKKIDQNFSKNFTIGFGESKYFSNKEQSEFLGFVSFIVSKIKTGQHEISTLFKYKNYCCLYYYTPETNETNMFIVKTTDEKDFMEYLIVVPGEVAMPPESINLKNLFDKVGARAPITPGPSSKNITKTPRTSIRSPDYTPGGHATAGYDVYSEA